MANVTLYTENESNWFSADCKDSRGRGVTVEVFADTQDGAEKRLESSADDYNIGETSVPQFVGPASAANDFTRDSK